MKYTLIALFVTLLLGGVSLAFAYPNNTAICLDENMSQVFVNGSISANNTCNWKCNSFSGECNPTPYDLGILWLFFPMVSAVMLYFASLLKEEDWHIHIFLIGVAMFTLIMPLGFMSEAYPVGGLYQLFTVLGFIVVFYYILKVIIRSTQLMGGKTDET